MSDRKPQRSAARYRATLPATMMFRRKPYPCVAEDLSRSGVLLVGELPPRPVRAEATVKIQATKGDLELEVRGVVARVQEANGETRLGLAFGMLTDEQHEVVDALIARVAEGLQLGALEALPPNPTVEQVRAALETISIPHRVALATRGDHKAREWVLKDPSPVVLDALARNPQLTLRDVRALLRLRNLIPSTIETIAKDGRWRGNSEIKLAVASHPRSPVMLVEKIAATLNLTQLKRLVKMPGLQSDLRLKLGQKLDRSGTRTGW